MSGVVGAVLFWSFAMPMNYSDVIGQELRLETGRIRVENKAAIVPSSEHLPNDEAGRVLFPHRLPQDPPKGKVQLHITLSGFAPDFLHGGLYFVSAAWREAAALGADEVLYLPVDTSTSLPEVQAKDYRVLWPIAMRDWIDLDRAGMREYPPGFWRIGRPIFRTDITVDVDIFHTPHFGHLFVTEALAARLTDAGIAMDFHDRSYPRYPGDIPPGTSAPRRGD